MKISVDDKELYMLSETQKKVIKDYVHEDIFDEDMKKRLHWVLTHLYEQAFKQLKESWDQKLIENKVKTVPTDPDEYAELVFKQTNYKSRKQRDASEAVNE